LGGVGGEFVAYVVGESENLVFGAGSGGSSSATIPRCVGSGASVILARLEVDVVNIINDETYYSILFTVRKIVKSSTSCTLIIEDGAVRFASIA